MPKLDKVYTIKQRDVARRAPYCRVWDVYDPTGQAVLKIIALPKCGITVFDGDGNKVGVVKPGTAHLVME